MYIDLYDYPPYIKYMSESFETKINSNTTFIHGYSNSSKNYENITWVNKEAWDILEIQFP